MKKELRWRVIYGYQPNDYLVVDEEMLEKVKYAWITKSIYDYKINGAEIKRIEPDFRHYTGWNDRYFPKDSEDTRQIERDAPTKELEAREKLADSRVQYIIENDKPELLNKIEELDALLPEMFYPLLNN